MIEPGDAVQTRAAYDVVAEDYASAQAVLLARA
jgi:hypothetical protein